MFLLFVTYGFTTASQNLRTRDSISQKLIPILAIFFCFQLYQINLINYSILAEDFRAAVDKIDGINLGKYIQIN